MKKTVLKLISSSLTLILLTVVFSRSILMIPPLGLVLNPFRGMVQNEKVQDNDKDLVFGRKNTVEISFDERSVPHIFADNQEDLFFAQGYVCASNRLWQMDFLSYVAAGRLCEIFGGGFIENDRRQRRQGIASAAAISLQLIESNPETRQALDSYTEGVNNYINGLSYKNFPLEYKLLGYRPEPWTNLKSVLILKYMGALLSGYEEDVSSSYLLAILGKKDYEKLFSGYIINEAGDKSTGNKSLIERLTDSLPSDLNFKPSDLETASLIQESPYNPRLGSNCWAISPQKSSSGSAILCNDPHLNLSFPAVWYEMQLFSNEMNVYGYSIPGTPGIIIGYNQKISWGLTNGATDVYDFYRLVLKDDYSQYQYDGSWKNTQKNIEEIKIKGAKSFYDTIYSTVHGPISSDLHFGDKVKKGLAIKWLLHDPSNEFLAFLKLNKASNYTEFKEAIKHYKCPVQNFTYADVEGNIAMHHQGKILKTRWRGRGKFVLDGTRSDNLVHEVLTQELPYVYNPNQGFVYSANNNPFQKTDSFSPNGHYFELRACKIKQFLSEKNKLTLEDMKLMQLNNTSPLAELAIPVLVSFLPNDNSEFIMKCNNWDCTYNKDSEIAALFEKWWIQIQSNTWDEISKYKKIKRIPDDLVLLELISNDPNNSYFDIQSTSQKESAKDIIQQSLKEAIQKLRKPHIKWGDINRVNIMHVTNISGFSRIGIPSSGHPNVLNALSKDWGPSLRLIVEMNKKPTGYGVYAGGQSGNPASREYDQFVDDWINGKYYPLNFFLSKNETGSHVIHKWTIK